MSETLSEGFKEFKELCNTQLSESDDITQPVNKCMDRLSKSAISNMESYMVYLIIVELILYILFSSILQNMNIIKVLKAAGPIMLIISLLSIIISVITLLRISIIKDDIMGAVSKERDKILISSHTFIFENETQYELGNTDSIISSIRFKYIDNSVIRYITFEKSQNDLFMDNLVKGNTYKFLSIDNTYYLIIQYNEGEYKDDKK